MKNLFALFAVPLLCCAFAAAQPRAEVKVCTYGKLQAQCGTLMVEENRTHPGRKIPIYFVIIPALGEPKEEDPMLQLQGGPGVPGTPFAEGQAETFAWVRKHRDIVILDQRGTGKSNLLACGLEDSKLTLQQGLSDLSDEVPACLEKLKGKADLSAYHAGESVEDIEELRNALGWKKINLFGISYGSRLAMQYARMHPAAVRTITLEGPLPPELPPLPQGFAAGAQKALDGIMAECEKNKDCHDNFRDVHNDLRQALARFDHGAIEVTAEHPATHEKQKVKFRRETFTETLRGYLNSSAEAVEL